MPRAYSEDLRLRAVWLHFFLGYDTEETAGLLAMSVRSVERYLRKYVRRVIDAINASGALLIFLPPYSPHLMPCEGVIGQAKSWIRENELVWEQCDELETMVFEAFMQITDEEIANYIRHCEYL